MHRIAHTMPEHDDPDWQALFDVALTARPRLTARIETAVMEALQAEPAEPSEICMALAHVLAEHASRSEDPEKALAAAFRMATLFTRTKPANDRT